MLYLDRNFRTFSGKTAKFSQCFWCGECRRLKIGVIVLVMKVNNLTKEVEKDGSFALVTSQSEVVLFLWFHFSFRDPTNHQEPRTKETSVDIFLHGAKFNNTVQICERTLNNKITTVELALKWQNSCSNEKLSLLDIKRWVRVQCKTLCYGRISSSGEPLFARPRSQFSSWYEENAKL